MGVRILLTCVGGTMSPDLLMCLRADPILTPYLIGVDASSQALGGKFVDAFYQIPWGDDPEYVDKIVDIVAREEVAIIVPCSDLEAFRLSAESERIREAGGVVLASPPSVLTLIRDKAATYRILAEAGLRVPEYTCVNNADDLEGALKMYDYPRRSVVLKPTAGRGARGMRLLVGQTEKPSAWIGAGARERRYEAAPRQEEMVEWLSETLMVMPVLNAPAYDVDVYAVRGRSRAALVRRRNNPAGIPFRGNCIVASPAVMQYCLEIAEVLKLDALHDIDLMTDAEGRPCLLEVNPRPSGSVVAAHAAGFPIVAAAIAERLGQLYPLAVPTSDIEVAVVPRVVVPETVSQDAARNLLR